MVAISRSSTINFGIVDRRLASWLSLSSCIASTCHTSAADRLASWLPHLQLPQLAIHQPPIDLHHGCHISVTSTCHKSLINLQLLPLVDLHHSCQIPVTTTCHKLFACRKWQRRFEVQLAQLAGCLNLLVVSTCYK